jgi:hypothetical protein
MPFDDYNRMSDREILIKLATEQEYLATTEDLHGAIGKHVNEHHPRKKNSIIPGPSASAGVITKERVIWIIATAIAGGIASYGAF